MELNDHKHRRTATGRTCSLRLDESTASAITLAIERAEAALQNGHLLSPGEALALAGPEARHHETLFSIARDVAGATGGDLSDILCRLGERFPVYA